MLRLAPLLTIALLIGPVVAGILGVVLPAFGYLPTLGGNEITTAYFAALIDVPGIAASVLLSLATGLVTTFVALLIVVLFVAGWGGTRLFRLLRGLISPLLSVPHAAAAFGLAFLIAPSGWLVRLTSPWLTGLARPPDLLVINDPLGLAMMAGLIVKEIPFLLLVTLAALPQTDADRLSRVATSFGYGRTAGWMIAVLPRLYRQIRLPVYAVIAYASSVVDVALILGPTTPPPLAVQLVKWMNDADLSMRFLASAGALLQLAVTIAAIGIWRVAEDGFAALGRQLAIGGRRRVRDRGVRGGAAMAMGLAAGLVLAGLLVLALWSIAGPWRFPDVLPRGFTLDGWMRHLGGLSRPLAITIWTGFAATVIALALSLACLENEARTGKSGGDRALAILYLPLLVPQVAFLFGLQVLLLRIGIDDGMVALIFAHLIFVLPYVFLSLADPWRAFDHRYQEIAAGFGKSPARVFWRVRLPMLAAASLTAAAVGFAVSVGQYLPTLLIGAGRLPTVTTEAVALAAGGDRRVIGAYAIVQAALPFVGFWIALAVPAILFRNRRALRPAL
ncbi:MAG: ABC transporter permease subunit [Hyphomicrobiales bacterium]|nr:ABC transporter permease subunit [Hyphomicrobiales bacterium]